SLELLGVGRLGQRSELPVGGSGAEEERICPGGRREPRRGGHRSGCYGDSCQVARGALSLQRDSWTSPRAFPLAGGGGAGPTRSRDVCAWRLQESSVRPDGSRRGRGIADDSSTRRRAGLSRVCYSCAFLRERSPNYNPWL